MQKNHFYEKLVTAAPFAYAYHKLVLDENGRPVDYIFIEVNKAFEQLTGLKANEIINKTVTEAIPGIKDGRFDWIAYYGELTLQGGEKQFEQYSEPLQRWYHVTAYSPEPMHFVTLFRDITERKQKRNRLHELKQQYQSIVNTQKELICRFTPDTRLTFVNNAYCSVFGKPHDNLLGKSFLDFVPEIDHDFILEKINTLLQTQSPVTYEHRVITAEGKERWQKWVDSPILDDDKNVVSIQSVGYDITTTKRAHQKLQYKESLQQLLINLSTGLINVPVEQVDAALNEALKQIGIFTGMDRVYIFKHDYKKRITTNTHEWCAEGITPEIQNLQATPFDFFTDFMELHQKGHFVHYQRISDMPHEHSMRPILEMQGIQSLLLLPLLHKGKNFGFVGFDAVCEERDFSEAEIDLLKVFALMIANIEERRINEKLINEKQTLLEGVLESIQDGISVLNDDLTITFTNNTMKTWYASNLPFEGKKCYAVYHNRKNPCEPCPTIRALASGKVEKEVVPGLPGSKVQWLELFSYPIIDSDTGNATGVVEFVRDITERKRIENIQKIQYNIAHQMLQTESLAGLLDYTRKELSQLFDTTNFIVGLYNDETDTFRQVYYEDEHDDFFEWKADESLSGQVVKLEKSLLLTRDQIEQLAFKNKLELIGTPAACWLGVPIMLEKKPIGVMVVQSYSDENAYNENTAHLLKMLAHLFSIFIERRQMIEDLRAAKEKAQESDRFKSAFLANMSHEIRTPMNGILGFAELLKEPDISPEQQEKFIEVIEKSGQRMLNLINDIIDISKIESGQMDVMLSTFSVSEELQALYDFFLPQLQKENKPIHLILDIPVNDVVVSADKKKFQSIVTNLLSNAIKYTRQGEIKFGFSIKEQKLEFFVRDTGVGIEKEKMDHLFERFFQVKSESFGYVEGAGLGLSITKAFAEMLGGTIWAESEPGKGSVFYFTLPFEG